MTFVIYIFYSKIYRIDTLRYCSKTDNDIFKADFSKESCITAKVNVGGPLHLKQVCHKQSFCIRKQVVFQVLSGIAIYKVLVL